MKLPKSIIKKYGITKKAWSVYRGRKSSSSSKKSGGVRMARRRRRRATTRRAAPRRRKGGLMTNKAIQIGIGAAGVVAYEKFLSPMIPGGQAKDFVELIGGIALTQMRVPSAVKYTGMALATINGYAIVSKLLSGTALGNGGTPTFGGGAVTYS